MRRMPVLAVLLALLLVPAGAQAAPEVVPNQLIVGQHQPGALYPDPGVGCHSAS